MALKKITLSMTDEMYDELEKERKRRRLPTIAETARVVIGEFLSQPIG
jgi:hypothetical protein